MPLVVLQESTSQLTDMKLYKISQSHNTEWYTYDSAIVAADSKERARLIIPSPFYFYDDGFYYQYNNQEPKPEDTDPSWCDPQYVTVEEIGTTDKDLPAIISTSFNAGFDESRYLDMRRLGGKIASGKLTEQQVLSCMTTLKLLEEQLHDRGLAELRYHLIEANRKHDAANVKEYELKVRDYMNEEYEDWS
jgi:hypothetical protein